MQPAQSEKLKSLIQKSPILSEIERSEWLTLLELMDDKQANELEKILDGAEEELQNPKPGFLAQKTPAKPAVAAASPAQGQKPAVPAGLSFKHIMNFPKAQGIAGKKEKEAVTPAPASQADKKAEQVLEPQTSQSAKAGSLFAAKLKSMFVEKELKPGHLEPTEELELPERTSVARAAKPSEPQKPIKPAPPIVPKPQTQPAKAVISQKPESPAKPKEAALQEKEPKKPLPTVSKPDLAHITKTGADILASIEGKKEPKKSFGVSFAKMSDSDREETLKSAKANLGQTASVPDLNALKEPKDASILNANWLEKQHIGLVTNKLKSMASRFGYHEILFNLERSPLHKVYIDTGVKLLDGQTAFEQLPEGKYLTKQQFEGFVDMLRQLQAG